MKRSPTREIIEAVCSEEGARVGVGLAGVLGASHAHLAVAARKRAWLRLAEAYPILNIATVWGCDRRGIQRALAEAQD